MNHGKNKPSDRMPLVAYQHTDLQDQNQKLKRTTGISIENAVKKPSVTNSNTNHLKLSSKNNRVELNQVKQTMTNQLSIVS